MRSCLRIIVSVVALLLSGCATRSLDLQERQLNLTKDEAIVLVGINSNVPLGSVKQACTWTCITREYALGGRKDILAFPVPVGTGFKLDSIRTLDSRIASLGADELKIDRRGVYYYGTIQGDSFRVGLGRSASPYFLLAAKRKFGVRFDGLETVNFTWPPAADDGRIRFGYPISALTQTELRLHERKRLHVSALAPFPGFDAQCRAIGPLSPPEFLPHEEYIRRAFNAELDASQMYDEKPGSVALKGAVTELSFSSQPGANAYWRIGLRLEMPGGRLIALDLTEPFTAPLNAGLGCASVEDAFPEAVQKLIEAAVKTPEFRALLSSPASVR